MQFSENGVDNTVQRCVGLLHANADYFLPHGRQNPAQHRLLPTAAASVQSGPLQQLLSATETYLFVCNHFRLGQVPQLSSEDELLGTAGTILNSRCLPIAMFTAPTARFLNPNLSSNIYQLERWIFCVGFHASWLHREVAYGVLQRDDKPRDVVNSTY